MSHPITVALTALMLVSPLPNLKAQPRWDSSNTKGIDEYKRPATRTAAVYAAAATVIDVDRQAGTVTLSHGPIKGLDAPSMTMSFVVLDKTLFESLEASRTVNIQFVQQGMSFVIVSVVRSAARSGTPAA